MKAVELRQYTDEELERLLEEKKKQLMDLRFQLSMGQLNNYSQMKLIKRDIARIKTVLRERELGIRR